MAQKLGNLFIDGENSFNDKSGNNHTVTVHGNPVISTTEKKFGNSSIYFNGDGDFLSTPVSDDLNFGSGDFTIDFWVNLDSLSEGQALLANNNTNGFGAFIFYVGGGLLQLYMGSSGTNFDIKAGDYPLWSPSINTWHHIALVRSGNTFIMFQDGTSVGSFTSSAPLASGESTLNIANRPYNSLNNYTMCNMDNVRLVKGEALWTSNFNVNDTDAMFYTPVNSYVRPDSIKGLYDITKKAGVRNAAKAGFVRPTLSECFMTHKDFVEIVSTTVPNAPIINSVVKGSNKVIIDFSAPEYDGGNVITSYTAVSSPGNFTNTVSQSKGGTIIVSGLTNGTSYTFTIFATNSRGNSAVSNNSNAVVPNLPEIGELLQGGYYFGSTTVDNVLYGLICSSNTSGETNAAWGGYNHITPGADSVSDGYQNTLDLLNDTGYTHPAAEFCRNLTIGGYTDWYLPSKNELALLRTRTDAIVAAGAGPFAPNWYTSSTEYNNDTIFEWVQGFSLGNNASNGYKNTEYHVRAIRRFVL